jgi:serine/threonine protein kinase
LQSGRRGQLPVGPFERNRPRALQTFFKVIIAGNTTLIPGTKLGPYQISAALGAGGIDEVYRARNSRLGRDVVIKVLLPEASESLGEKGRGVLSLKDVSALNF